MKKVPHMKVRYLKLERAEGPLVVMNDVKDIVYDEIVEIEIPGHGKRMGKVIQVDRSRAIIQVFEGTSGISLQNTSISFSGKPMEIPVSKDILGRVFDGAAEIDGAGEIYSDVLYINGRPMNFSRLYPKLYPNGISTIDGLATLIRGQITHIFR